MNKKWKTLLVGILIGVATATIATNASAKPIAIAEGDNGAYVVLGDDQIDQCPVGSLAAVGKDMEGKEYVGCWYLDKAGVVHIYWLNTGEQFLVPEELFVPLELDIKV